jgi:hypothetical protein
MDTVLAGRKAATGSLLVNLEIARLAAIQHLLPASGQAHIVLARTPHLSVRIVRRRIEKDGRCYSRPA